MNKPISQDAFTQYTREVISGHTGAGKTECVLPLIKDCTGLVLMVRKSTAEMLEIQSRLSTQSITSEILIARATAEAHTIEYTPSVNPSTKVAIISLTAYLSGSFFGKLNGRKPSYIIVDELSPVDVLVPAWKDADMFTEETQYNTARMDYLTRFRQLDITRVREGSRTVVSSAFYPPCDISILSAEPSTVELLKTAGYTELNVADRVNLKECTLKFHTSPLFLRSTLDSKGVQDIVNSYDFVISNILKGDKVTNFLKAKGSNAFVNSNGCAIIRNMPSSVSSSLEVLCDGYVTDIVPKTFIGEICQAAGRTLGNRGAKSFDIYIHSGVMDLIRPFLDLIPYSCTEESYDLGSEARDLVAQARSEEANKVKDRTAKDKKNQLRAVDRLIKKGKTTFVKGDLPVGLSLTQAQKKFGGKIRKVGRKSVRTLELGVK